MIEAEKNKTITALGKVTKKGDTTCKALTNRFFVIIIHLLAVKADKDFTVLFILILTAHPTYIQ